MTTARPQRRPSHKRANELPKNTRLVKRQLSRPRPPPRLSADPKIVYVSTKSPFISTVKRVRKALEVFKDQSKVSVASGGRQKRAFQRKQQTQPRFHRGGQATDEAPQDNRKKHVTIKATGKAIEKALALGLYFQEQKDTTIEIKTGTVTCTDEVVLDRKDTFEELMEVKERAEQREQKAAEAKEKGEDVMDVDEDIPEEIDDFEEIDDKFPSRTRSTSVIEVIVRNKIPA
ncbi:hypothetical protein H072_10454 [Dactylellina haptotyla CBS 200.50]|uniref:Uncharacterized protein n=1 Tax=Dactylellina haptotyla (strain CBS 200.50) TaxID=1284197 RepID=S8BLF2_DACHA|nr:hypothetical protein H072_10454 [Dactylellina haptotyla CBS 200.50]